MAEKEGGLIEGVLGADETEEREATSAPNNLKFQSAGTWKMF